MIQEQHDRFELDDGEAVDVRVLASLMPGGGSGCDCIM